MKVIPHPTQLGFWTILVTEGVEFPRIYGSFDRYALAVSTMLTR